MIFRWIHRMHDDRCLVRRIHDILTVKRVPDAPIHLMISQFVFGAWLAPNERTHAPAASQ
jgi:hypothetical protein